MADLIGLANAVVAYQAAYLESVTDAAEKMAVAAAAASVRDERRAALTANVSALVEAAKEVLDPPTPAGDGVMPRKEVRAQRATGEAPVPAGISLPPGIGNGQVVMAYLRVASALRGRGATVRQITRYSINILVLILLGTPEKTIVDRVAAKIGLPAAVAESSVPLTTGDLPPDFDGIVASARYLACE